MDNSYQQSPLPSQPQQLNTTVPPILDSSKSFGWLKWVLIVAVVAILSSTATYFVVQSQSTKQTPKQIAQTPPSPTLSVSPAPNGVGETANWQVYKGQFFSIRYPSNWNLDSTNSFLVTSRPTYKKAGGDYTPGRGEIYFNITNESFQNVISSISGVDKKEQIVIDGYPATKLSGYTGVAGSVYFITVAINKNGKTLTVNLTTQDADLEIPLTQEFNQILSTFKFLD